MSAHTSRNPTFSNVRVRRRCGPNGTSGHNVASSLPVLVKLIVALPHQVRGILSGRMSESHQEATAGAIDPAALIHETVATLRNREETDNRAARYSGRAYFDDVPRHEGGRRCRVGHRSACSAARRGTRA